jgi:hypothetical protein
MIETLCCTRKVFVRKKEKKHFITIPSHSLIIDGLPQQPLPHGPFGWWRPSITEAGRLRAGCGASKSHVAHRKKESRRKNKKFGAGHLISGIILLFLFFFFFFFLTSHPYSFHHQF